MRSLVLTTVCLALAISVAIADKTNDWREWETVYSSAGDVQIAGSSFIGDHDEEHCSQDNEKMCTRFFYILSDSCKRTCAPNDEVTIQEDAKPSDACVECVNTAFRRFSHPECCPCLAKIVPPSTPELEDLDVYAIVNC